MRIKQMWLPPYINSSGCGKDGGAMVEQALLTTIHLLFFGLVGMTIIAIFLAIALVAITFNNNKKTHL
ncbi:MAG: hypothetical protein FWC79_06320 [Oscillospiraceae bacterium]|nr:hypothetical protein [Oscillospiraceae bacterium]